MDVETSISKTLQNQAGTFYQINPQDLQQWHPFVVTIQVLETQLPNDPNRFALLINLGHALGAQFEGGGQRTDLDESISLYRQALEIQPLSLADQSPLLFDLACALWTRFKEGSQSTDLDEAISFHRQALELRLLHHPDRFSSVFSLAYALTTRFLREGQQADIDEAISLRRQTLELRPPSHPERFLLLNNLGFTLLTKFKRGGLLIDLDEAISFIRQALELGPGQFVSLDEFGSALDNLGSAPDNLEFALDDLGSALVTRFERGGQPNDLDEAISLYRKVLELQPPSHLSSRSLNSLGYALEIRFKQGGQLNDLDEAISLHRQALERRLPPHSKRADSLNHLALALSTRFNERGQQIDLDEAISLHRQALELPLAPPISRSTLVSNLALVLLAQFEEGGRRSDLDEAISLHRQALELRLSPDPDRSASLYELGTLLIRAHSLDDNGRKYLDEAMSSFVAATQCLSQTPLFRFRVAMDWIDHAERYQDLSAIDAYDAALQALPQVAALNFHVQSQQKKLATNSDNLARNGSRCAIRSGDLDKAIELLEAGRSVFWSRLGSPFSQLYDIAPELVDKLRGIATELQCAQDPSDRLEPLNKQWEKFINQARNLQGFENFLRPSRLSSLKSAASKRPVIILVANDDDSHCLIMTLTRIHHIPLPSLSTPHLRKLVRLVQIAVSQLPMSESFTEKIRDEITELLGEDHAGKMRFGVGSNLLSDDIFRYILRVLWDELVKPIINLLDIKKSGEMSVLQWYPTGHFTFLPIHAAGCYDNDLVIECAFDYFISSYIPTIGALLAPPPVPASHPFKMMVVIQSQGLAFKELNNIQRHVSSDALVKFGVPGAVADVEAVASRLSEVSIVHFTCNGKQDRLEPIKSGLELDGGFLPVLRIMKEKIPNGSLAFLCACETMMDDGVLPDEAMSLGASLLFSGFHSVITVMWKTNDQDRPTIADAFYGELFQGPDRKPTLEPDTRKSAQALHVAVQKLRAQNISFRRWVPFIHMGK